MVEKTLTKLGNTPMHPLAFFERLEKNERSVCYFTSGNFVIIAWNPKESFNITTIDDLKKIQGEERRNQQKPLLMPNGERVPFMGGKIGFLPYDLGTNKTRISNDKNMTKGVMHRYTSAVIFHEMSSYFFGSKKEKEGALQIFHRSKVTTPLPSIRWACCMTPSRYRRDITSVLQGIRNGNFYQLNYTYEYCAQKQLSPEEKRILFATTLYHHPATAATYIEYGDAAILSFSPERFVVIENDTIQTCPIKGTRPRGSTEKEDKKNAEKLLRSEKEAAELHMIMDLLRNDIGKVSVTGTVRVKKNRELQKNVSVWHTYSVIEGKKLPELSPFDVFLSLFPGGSITGCPKEAAMREITKREKRSRGAYCGSGFLLSDCDYFDSTILIRTIEALAKKLTFGVGGGIVIDSNIQDEWNETRAKAKPFVSSQKKLDDNIMTSSAQRIVMMNGCIAPSADHRTLHLNPWNGFAEGVFETMLVVQNQVQDLHEHLCRLEQSAKLMNLHCRDSMKKLPEEIRQLLKQFPEEKSMRKLKIVIGHTYRIIALEKMKKQKKAMTACIIPCRRTRPQIKALPYTKEWNAHQKALSKRHDEALLLQPDGTIPEGAYSNLFWIKDDTLFTARDNILEGITRAKVIQIAQKLGIDLCYRAAKKGDLLNADVVFITKSTTGMTPITRIDHKKIRNKNLLFRNLKKAYATFRLP